MVNFKRYIAGAAMFLTAAGTAMAADHGEAGNSGYSWDGFYIGIFAGGYIGDTTITPMTTTTPVNGNVGNAGGSTNGILGALIGYNVLAGNWVIGAEADIGWSNADGNGIATMPPPPPATAPIYRYDVGLVGHIRARAGVLISPNTLVFAAGGLAFADIDTTELTGTTGWGGTALGGIRYGFTIGGGVEHAFSNRVSARLEYLYDDFGSKTYTHGTSTYSSSANAHIIRASLNFKFY